MRKINPKLLNLTDEELENIENEINEAIKPYQDTLHDIILLKQLHKYQKGNSLKDEFVGIQALKEAGLIARTKGEQELHDAITKWHNKEPLSEREQQLIDDDLEQIDKGIKELEAESSPSLLRRLFKG